MHIILRTFHIILLYSVGKKVCRSNKEITIYCIIIAMMHFERCLWVANTANDCYLELFLTLSVYFFVNQQTVLGAISVNFALGYKVGAMM